MTRKAARRLAAAIPESDAELIRAGVLALTVRIAETTSRNLRVRRCGELSCPCATLVKPSWREVLA